MTRIIPVVDGDGATVKGAAWGRPNSVLFEIKDGERAGLRAPDVEIYDTCGRIEVDWSVASDFETGRRVAFKRR